MASGQTSARGELRLYYALVALYFFAFGLQFVLFPSLTAFTLDAGGANVGLAQTALSAPMFALLLFGGVAAESVRAGPALAALQTAFAVPPLLLAAAALLGALSLPILIAYGIAMGSLAAFMLPIRDAALNGVVERAAAQGGGVLLARAATTTTAVQIGAQIAGILTARLAERLGAAPLLALQALCVLCAAALALRLRAPKPVGSASLAGAFGAIHDGLAYAFGSQVMAPMIWSAAYVGVFVIGSFQVLFPLIVREAYGGGASELGVLYAAFWAASFVSAVVLGRIAPITRPGRLLILCHLIGAASLAAFAFEKPWWAFVALTGVWGLAAGISIATSRTITQGCADQAYLGRVLAVYSMGFMGGAPIGSILVGFAAESVGPRMAAIFPAIGMALGATALATLSPLWRLERRV